MAILIENAASNISAGISFELHGLPNRKSQIVDRITRFFKTTSDHRMHTLKWIRVDLLNKEYRGYVLAIPIRKILANKFQLKIDTCTGKINCLQLSVLFCKTSNTLHGDDKHTVQIRAVRTIHAILAPPCTG